MTHLTNFSQKAGHCLKGDQRLDTVPPTLYAMLSIPHEILRIALQLDHEDPQHDAYKHLNIIGIRRSACTTGARIRRQ
jgi:hypothetical protein